ncbi:MAG: SDR family oxidoreductase [Actinobacteria bacterium]|nr:SDR family oxidoreductase [Actinomycetota bacterium]
MRGTALVTGGASGIGRAIVRRLAAEGMTLLVVDVDEPAGREVASEVGGAFVRADVSSTRDWEHLAGEAGPLRLACLNAGVGTATADVTELSDEEYRRVLGVNVDGVVFGVRALAPLLEGGGGIVATASLAGLVPIDGDPIYGLTKHAVIGFVRSVAPQLERRGIAITAVCPGIADTPLVGAAARAQLDAAGFPLLQPEEVAGAVVVAAESGQTGQAWVCQPGREPLQFRFPNVPGPRTPGAEGLRPPVDAEAFTR